MWGEVSKSGTSIDSKIVLLGKTLISFSISKWHKSKMHSASPIQILMGSISF